MEAGAAFGKVPDPGPCPGLGSGPGWEALETSRALVDSTASEAPAPRSASKDEMVEDVLDVDAPCELRVKG